MTDLPLYDDPELWAVVQADVETYGEQVYETHREAIRVFGKERATAQMRSTLDMADDTDFAMRVREAIARQAERLKERHAEANGTLGDLIRDFPTVREQIEDYERRHRDDE